MISIILISVLMANTLALYHHNISYITTLTTEDFDSVVLDSHEIWVVEFYAKWCSHCQKFAKEYKKIARIMRGYVRFGAVNGDQQQKLSNRYNVQEYPSIQIFGVNKETPEKLPEEKRHADGIVEKSLLMIKEKIDELLKPRLVKTLNVIELYDNTFYDKVMCSRNAWLVYFYGANCFDCTKNGVTLVHAAKSLRGKLKIGAMDVETNKLLSSENQNVLRYFPFERKISHDIINYSGNMTVEEITNWALEQYKQDKNQANVYQITNEAVLRDVCEGTSKCVVTFLPSIKDCAVDCRNDYLDLMKEMSKTFEHELWGWLWTAASEQVGIEEALEVKDLGYPSVIVVDVPKKTYYTNKGALEQDTLKDFFDDVANGSAEPKKLEEEQLPTIENVEFWCDIRSILDDKYHGDDNEIKDEL